MRYPTEDDEKRQKSFEDVLLHDFRSGLSLGIALVTAVLTERRDGSSDARDAIESTLDYVEAYRRKNDLPGPDEFLEKLKQKFYGRSAD